MIAMIVAGQERAFHLSGELWLSRGSGEPANPSVVLPEASKYKERGKNQLLKSGQNTRSGFFPFL